MFDTLDALGLTPGGGAAAGQSSGFLDFIGYRVHGTRTDLAVSNVADVFKSIVNMFGTAVTLAVIQLSPSLARRFGKKAVAVSGFLLSALNVFAFYLLGPANTLGMVLLLTVLGAVTYALSIPLVWAIYTDVEDYSELQTGRRFTGMVVATIGFALKSGLAIGSASFLWVMAAFFDYETNQPLAADAASGDRVRASLAVGMLFATCTALLAIYQLKNGQ